MSRDASRFVSRAGEKLDAALEAFRLDVSGLVCADFGCNVGGFTDCLLRRGAAKVYAVDTGYGALAWRLRRDERVAVLERTNALHADPPEPVALITIDVAWTPQERIVTGALRWLGPGGRIVSLLKPHYELAKLDRPEDAGRGASGGHRAKRAALSDAEAEAVCRTVCERLSILDVRVLAAMRSGLRGKGGNVEFLLLIEPAAE